MSIEPETASCSVDSRRFLDLRGVRWRIDLGILPASESASIDDLRRVTANSRRRYASLRRQLLVDPHVTKDGIGIPDRVMDNPLSQNPDSMWGRFFRNAELERMVDQDLTRLYPERGSYFQTSGCQGMLRRILLLWCLRNPEYGYRQGMHELLAPLLYVLHVDVNRLSEVRKLYNDYFADTFDGFSFHENDLTYKFDFKKFSEFDNNGLQKPPLKANSSSELSPETHTIVLLSDAYGAEGELGVVLSEKFMEHDAYSMFDALMSGTGGVFSMAAFFSPSALGNYGFPPVIEASAALYHLLSIVDSSLHSHLVELGVEPQYFALRWLRVLFGREFSLENLLTIWDEIFACENSSNDSESDFGVLGSPRGAFVSAFAVSMILKLRSSLLATENATACLMRLLNFPDDVNLGKIITKATSLQAMDVNYSNALPIHENGKGKSVICRGHTHSLSLDSNSPKTPLNIVSESYWEEKWRDLHKEEEIKQNVFEKQVPNRIKGWSEKVKSLRLSRTESDPSPSKKKEKTKNVKPFFRRNLLEDLAKQLGSAEEENPGEVDVKNGNTDKKNDASSGAGSEANSLVRENPGEGDVRNVSSGAGSEANSENFSELNIDNENEFERSSVASNSFVDDAESNVGCSPLPVSDPPIGGPSLKSTENEDFHFPGKFTKERKILSGKFHWLWKFGRNGGDGTTPEDAKTTGRVGSGRENVSSCFDTAEGSSSYGESKRETVDQIGLRNLGQTMLENIQVIESAFKLDPGEIGSSKNVVISKEQEHVMVMTAIEELKKISNLLSEM